MTRSEPAASIAVVDDIAESLAALAQNRDGNPKLRVLSLGGGVQSATLSLLAQRGDFEARPDVAIFADTGWERSRTIEMVTWIAAMVDWPVVRVTAKHRDGSEANIRDDLMASRNSSGQPFVVVPQFTIDSRDGSAGMGRRQCTREYKIEPIMSAIRRLLGVRPRGRLKAGWEVETWSGLSTDEYWRLKSRRVQWERQRQPLMEMGMNRQDCIRYWHAHAPLSAPALGRSSCVGCPYHDMNEWVSIAREIPEALKDAAEVEVAMNHNCQQLTTTPHIENFLHRRRIPLLDAVALDIAETSIDAGWRKPQDITTEEGSFNEECDGVCDL